MKERGRNTMEFKNELIEKIKRSENKIVTFPEEKNEGNLRKDGLNNSGKLCHKEG